MSEPIPDDLAALLAKPMLWGDDLRRLAQLAKRYRVPVAVFCKDLAPNATWRKVDVIGNERSKDHGRGPL